MSSGYGLTPDDWQEDILDDWLGRRADGRWSAATCALAVPRQNGKNGVIEIRELFGMVALGEKFLHTAHEVKTARKAFLRISSFFENQRQYPELAALVKDIRKTNGQEAVILTNGGSVEFIARSKGSGRGFTVDVLICDEAQDLSDEKLAALLPTISAAPLGNPQVVLTGTPPDSSKGQDGEVFQRVRADAEAKRDKRLAWADFGIGDGALPDIDNRGVWVRSNPALGIRLAIPEVERERALMSPETFARERLGWWGDPATSASAFGHGAWAACATLGAFPDAPGAIALACDRDQRWASIAAAALLDVDAPEDAEDAEVVFVAPVDRRRGTDWLIAEAHRIHTDTGCPVLVDAGGPLAFLIPRLEEADVPVDEVDLATYARACSNLVKQVREQRLFHPNAEELNAAVRGSDWRWVGDRRVWGRKASENDVSMLEAATLAAHGAVEAGAFNIY